MADAVFFPRNTDASIAGNVYSDLYAWAWGIVDRPTVPSYQPLMWMDMKAFQASLRRALELDFDHVAAVHGSWRTIDGDARTVLARDLGWVLEMSKLEQLGLIANFVGRHPQIFWRFLQLTREQAKAKRALERGVRGGS